MPTYNPLSWSAGVLAGVVIFASTTVFAAQECTLELMQGNMAVDPEVRPTSDNRYIVEQRQPEGFISQQKRVPCTMADLLKLGFEYKGGGRSNPLDSTTGKSYESSSVWQKDQLAVVCYDEFEIDQPGVDALIVWSRAACQQIVPIRIAGRGSTSPPQ